MHCSDGWDRTPQTTALSQLILDPYYRTITGFQVSFRLLWRRIRGFFFFVSVFAFAFAVSINFGLFLKILITKEFISFGHKFNDRCGHTRLTDPKETSPIFTQFLDCTWQLLVQFPQSFEFNERYLLTLHDHVHSCQFGTFLGNSEKQRLDLRYVQIFKCRGIVVFE